MTDNALSAADVTGDIQLDDQAIEKFFESGGDESILVPATDTQAKEDLQQEPAKAESETNQQSETQKQRMVEYGALHEERERRKELQRELQEIRQTKQQYEQTLQRILERVAPAQQTAQVPSFEEDPLSNANYRLQTLEQRLQEREMTEAQREERQEYVRREQELIGNYQQSALAYTKQNPEFAQAYQYLVESRIKEHMAAGYTEAEAHQLLMEDEKAVVARAFMEKANPAERIFNIAKARGFTSPAAASNAQPATDKTLAKANEEKLNRMEKGIRESKSLSNISGKAESTDLSLDVLAAMSDDELDEFIGNKKNWSKLGKLMK